MDAMKYSRWTAGFPEFWGAVVLLSGLAAGPSRADVRFEEVAFNAGEARTGIPLSHAFRFVNEGPERVEITEVRPGCGCLIPRLERRSYQPAERGCLFVEINTLTQPAGPHTWPVQVQYRRGATVREVSLRVTARVVAEVTVQPAALTIISAGAVRHDVVFTDRRARPLTITAIRSSSPRLTGTLAAGGAGGGGAFTRTIHIEAADDFPEGRHEELVTISTDDPEYRELKVAVTLIKRSRQRVAAFPDQLSFTAATGGPLPSRLVRLRDRRDQPMRVERIDADDPAVTASWAPGPGTMATLKITVDRKRLGADPWQGAVHVHLGKPASETITIPVIVRSE
jgi:hypothetical protein